MAPVVVDEFKIRIFDNDDVSLKLLGELLGNDTSRRIMRFLIENESYTNQIATKLNLRISLVIHHLKKLEALDMIQISYKVIRKKGSKHRFFRMNPYFFLAPNTTAQEICTRGITKFYF